MGNPDPTDLINAEVNRIPFRAQNFLSEFMERYIPILAQNHQRVERLVLEG